MKIEEEKKHMEITEKDVKLEDEDYEKNPGRIIEDDRTCCLCADRKISTVIFPCKHSCLCCKCGISIAKSKTACPMCRKEITSIFKIF